MAFGNRVEGNKKGRTFRAYQIRKPWKKYAKAPHACWCGLRFNDPVVMAAHKHTAHKSA